MVIIIKARDIETANIDTCKWKGGSTSAKGTTSIELVSGAEIASAAEPEALEPGVYSELERRREAPLYGVARHVARIPP